MTKKKSKKVFLHDLLREGALQTEYFQAMKTKSLDNISVKTLCMYLDYCTQNKDVDFLNLLDSSGVIDIYLDDKDFKNYLVNQVRYKESFDTIKFLIEKYPSLKEAETVKGLTLLQIASLYKVSKLVNFINNQPEKAIKTVQNVAKTSFTPHKKDNLPLIKQIECLYEKALFSDEINAPKIFVACAERIKECLNSEPSREVAKDVLTILWQMRSCFHDKSVIPLLNFVINGSGQQKLDLLKAIACNDKARICINDGNYNNAIESSKFVVSLFEKIKGENLNQEKKQELACAHFNLGVSNAATTQFDTAKDHFQQAVNLFAEEDDKNDARVELTRIYAQTKDFENFRASFFKITSNELQKKHITEFICILDLPSDSELLRFFNDYKKVLSYSQKQNLDQCMDEVSLLMINCFYDKAIVVQKKVIDIAESEGCSVKNLFFYYSTLLSIFCAQDRFADGVNAINAFYEKYPEYSENHSDIKFKYYEFILHTEAGNKEEANNIIEQINKISNNSFFTINANAYHVRKLIQDKNFNEVQKYIEIIEKVDLKEAKDLQNLFDVALELSQSLDQSSKDGSDTDSLNEYEDYEVETFDPKAFHDFCQAAKKEAALRVLQDQARKSYKNWKIGEDKCYSSEDVDNIFTVYGRDKLYSTISDKLKAQLDPRTLKQCENALSKGMVFKAKGVNGIKLIDNAIYELKINKGLRLYTNKVYDNGDDSLIIFDDKCNEHDRINDILKLHKKLEVIKVEHEGNSSDAGVSPTDFSLDDSHVLKEDGDVKCSGDSSHIIIDDSSQ